jgi:hypothetical protein
VPIRVQAVPLARLVHGEGVTGDRDHRNDRAALHEHGVHPVLGQIPRTISERVPRILTHRVPENIEPQNSATGTHTTCNRTTSNPVLVPSRLGINLESGRVTLASGLGHDQALFDPLSSSRGLREDRGGG